MHDSNTAVQALNVQTSAVKSLRQESDAQMGKVNPWRTVFGGFFRERFSAATNPGRLTAIAETGPFIQFLSRFTAVYMRTYVFLRFAFQCVSMAEGLFRVLFAIKSIYFGINCFYLR